MSLILLRCETCNGYFFTPPIFAGAPGVQVTFRGRPTLIYTCPRGHEVKTVIDDGEYKANMYGVFELIKSLPIFNNKELLHEVIEKGNQTNLFDKDEVKSFLNYLDKVSPNFREIIQKIGGKTLGVSLMILLTLLLYYLYQMGFSKFNTIEPLEINKIENIKNP